MKEEIFLNVEELEERIAPSATGWAAMSNCGTVLAPLNPNWDYASTVTAHRPAHRAYLRETSRSHTPPSGPTATG